MRRKLVCAVFAAAIGFWALPCALLSAQEVSVHGDCPDFRGESRENGTVPFGRKGAGTFFGPARAEK